MRILFRIISSKLSVVVGDEDGIGRDDKGRNTRMMDCTTCTFRLADMSVEWVKVVPKTRSFINKHKANFNLLNLLSVRGNFSLSSNPRAWE